MSENSALADLSPREREIFNMLLEGAAIKEIAISLKIKYQTAAYHQKNLFQKLGVHNLNGLLVKYLREKSSQNINDINEGIPAVFTRWGTFKDDYGSIVGITVKDEKIKDDYVTSCTVFGTLSNENDAHAGVIVYPDTSTLENMKTMSSFSFTVLGDGNTYETLIATSDTILKGGLNHFRKKFTATKDIISTFNISIADLAQDPYFGKKVELNLNNIEQLIFQAYSNGKFNLKVWNIRISPK